VSEWSNQLCHKLTQFAEDDRLRHVRLAGPPEGTFLIENGRITRPVKDLRFTQSILEAFKGTLALTQSTKLQVSEYLGASRVPAVRLKAFDFTS